MKALDENRTQSPVDLRDSGVNALRVPFEVAIIIVNYNSGDLLRGCLKSLSQNVKQKFEILVVDNDSKDESLQNLPDIENLQIIQTGKNLGFAKACNVGAKAARAKIYHFLNPDASVTENINECYLSALEKPDAVYVTRIANTRTSTERSSYPIPTLLNILKIFLMPNQVENWYLGASVVVPRPVFESLGGWSEDYFMYAEDLDFFFKAKQANIPTVVSNSLVMHEQGGTTCKVWSDIQRLERIEKSAFIFARKNRLVLDYFVFRHLAFVKLFPKHPKKAVRELGVFWREFLSHSNSPQTDKRPAVF